MLVYIAYGINSMLGTKLNMTTEEAEKWIVNLIRNVRLDARIDAKQVCIPYSDIVSVVMCVLHRVMW